MIAVIVQARVGSTRLPRKVLRPIVGKPMLQRELERLQKSKKAHMLILATSDKPEDDALEQLAKSCEVRCFRGSETDVLGRYYLAAKEVGAETIVRVTGDCPLQDPEVIDLVIERFETKQVDETGTPSNFPEGLDTDVLSFSALEIAAKEAKLPSEREHVMPFIRNHPERFRLDEKWTHGDGDHSSYHWSVDTEADFRFVERIYEELGDKLFHMQDVIDLLEKKPELLKINPGGTGFEWIEKSRQEDQEWLKHHG